MARSFIDKIEKVLGPTRDIPAPDVGTDAQTMAWFMDEYGKLHGHTPAIVTGKPISLQGSLGREAATGRGVVFAFLEAARALSMDPTETRFVVQGFGNVGSWAARILQRPRRHDGGRVRRHGRDPVGGGHRAGRRCVDHLAAGGALTEFPGAERSRPTSCWPSTATSSSRPRSAGWSTRPTPTASAAACWWRAPTARSRPAADEILTGKGVEVVPDVLANAGGVVVSYFEWVQNLQHFSWDEDEVNERLGRIMRKAYGQVAGRAEASHVLAARGGVLPGDRARGGGGAHARLHRLSRVANRNGDRPPRRSPFQS